MVKELRLLCLFLLIAATACEIGFAEELHDPMVPTYYHAAAVPKPAPAPVKTNSWVLRAVLHSAGRSVALVNDQPLRTGDQLEGYRLVRIFPDHVVFKNKRKEVVLYRVGTGLKKMAADAAVKKGSTE